MKRVLLVLAVAGLATLGACSSGDDVDVTDERPLDTDTTRDEPDDSDSTDTTDPEISTPDTVGPDVTISVPPRPSVTVSPDPTTGEDEVEEDDRDLIVELWAGYDAAVKESVEAKVAYIASHSYPGLELTEEKCAEDPTAEGYLLVTGAALDDSTIAPEPDWVIRIPGSPVDGQTPDGTIYVHDVTLTYEDDTTETSAVHTTILDGTAYFFFDCEA